MVVYGIFYKEEPDQAGPLWGLTATLEGAKTLAQNRARFFCNVKGDLEWGKSVYSFYLGDTICAPVPPASWSNAEEAEIIVTQVRVHE